MMKHFYVLTTMNGLEWTSVLERVGKYDFYHLFEYHELYEKLGEGRGLLLVYQHSEKIIALPILVRPISVVSGLKDFDYYDATSVYGYPGPIASEEAADDSDFIRCFCQALRSYAKQHRLITFFSRMNPVLGNHELLTGIGEAVGLSDTVTIDLTAPLELQSAQYRKSHRYEIRRARREGMKVYRDVAWTRYDDFLRLYEETMQRVAADTSYFFDRTYFDDLQAVLGDRLHLFVAELDGTVCAASLFVHTNDIIQYHLSATSDECLRQAPSKLVIDEARKWGHSVGARWLHLGGGVGSKEDNLYRFKAGFSPIQHKFFIWKWIIQPDVYVEMTEKRQQWLTDHDRPIMNSSYFPAYRM